MCVDQDELSAVTMQKKHQIVEQAVEDYAETVHQLSKTSRGLVGDGHPERLATPPDHNSARLKSVFNSVTCECVCVCVSVSGSACVSRRWTNCTPA